MLQHRQHDLVQRHHQPPRRPDRGRVREDRPEAQGHPAGPGGGHRRRGQDPDLGLADTKGALLVFAYEAGTYKTTTPPGGNPKLVIVNSRSYTYGTDAAGNPQTYGQCVPGLPWYYYIDPGKKSRGLDKAVFTGLREDSAYRTAIGLVNISDELTALDVELTLNAQDGTQLAQEFIQMAPLSHEQYDQAIINLFGKVLTDAISGASLSVIVDSYSSGCSPRRRP